VWAAPVDKGPEALDASELRREGLFGNGGFWSVFLKLSQVATRGLPYFSVSVNLNFSSCEKK
jgi:hypothetical protein